MSRRRTAALLLIGVLVGSSVTVLVFHFASREAPAKTAASDEEADERDAGRGDSDDTAQEERSVVDVAGDCFFSGSVVDFDDEALEGALVRLRVEGQAWSDLDPEIQATTDAEGKFELGGVREDLAYQLWAYYPGLSVASLTNVRCGDGVDFSLDPGATLNLTFIKPDGDRADQVSVVIAGASLWPAREARTGADGELVIDGLEPGDYVLWAASAGLAFVSKEPVSVGRGGETVKEIELSKASAATASVLDSFGKPVKSGAAVVVAPSSTSLLYRVKMTDEKGAVIIPSLPDGRYTAQAIADGYVETTPVPIRPDDNAAFRLEVGATADGVVRDEAGNLIRGATLSVEQELGESLVAIPAGNGRSFRRRMLDAARSGWPMLYRLEGAEVVTGPHNMPLPDANRDVAESRGGAWRATDEAGRFFLDGLPSGRVSISAAHPEFVMQKPAELTLERSGAVEEAVVIMRRGSTATVRALDERGFPVAGAEIVAYDSSQEAVCEAMSGSDGFASLKGLPGVFRVVASAEGRVSAATRVDGKTGNDVELNITLPPADRIMRGRVTDENGFGVADAVVIARSITKGLVHVLTGTTQSDGTFAIEEAGAGSYHMTADAGERGRAQLGDARFDMDLKLVLDTKAPVPEMITPEQFAEAVGVPQTYEASSQGDNLGVTGSGVEPGSVQTGQSFNTQFGQADELAVTGPPSGKGGLPITLGGGSGGAVVTGVVPGSQVDGAGLAKGDRILEVDGRKIKGPAQARAAIAGPIGTVVMLKVDRNGDLFTVVVQRQRVRGD